MSASIKNMYFPLAFSTPIFRERETFRILFVRIVRGKDFAYFLASKTVLSFDSESIRMTSKFVKCCSWSAFKSRGRNTSSLSAGIITEKNNFMFVKYSIGYCRLLSFHGQ